MSEVALKISDAAVSRIKKLIENKDQGDLKFRVHIQGGGCSGFQYGFQLDEATLEDDIVLKRDGVDVLVDPLSMQYLHDAEVDFKDDLQGSRFFVNNPNAETTGGGGSSFSSEKTVKPFSSGNVSYSYGQPNWLHKLGIAVFFGFRAET